VNAWHGVGNLTRDPESGTTQSGIVYCRFTVACQRRFKDASGNYQADFIQCTAWRQTAEFVQRWFKKGDRIGVSGSITTGSYTGQDGQKRYTTEVTVDNVEFVGGRSDGGGQAAQSGSSQSAGGQPNRNPNGTIPGIMQPPRNQSQGTTYGSQQRMDLNGQSNDDFMEVDDDELPF